MNFFKFSILLLFVFSLGPFASASIDKTEVLSFKDWKGSQVLDAKNQVVRLTNRITLLKKGILREASDSEDKKPDATEMSDRTKTAENKDLISQVESQLKLALENLQFTTELSLQDYFAVYLTRFKDEPELMATAAEKLSKEEVLELLKAMMKREGTPGAATPNAAHARGSLVEGLVTTNR